MIDPPDPEPDDTSGHVGGDSAAGETAAPEGLPPGDNEGEGREEPATPGDDEADAEAAAVPEWERRRRLAEVFGDVLPATTRDERGSRPGRGAEWYRRETPPHHGS